MCRCGVQVEKLLKIVKAEKAARMDLEMYVAVLTTQKNVLQEDTDKVRKELHEGWWHVLFHPAQFVHSFNSIMSAITTQFVYISMSSYFNLIVYSKVVSFCLKKSLRCDLCSSSDPCVDINLILLYNFTVTCCWEIQVASLGGL